jgi:anti-anti-sigma factor
MFGLTALGALHTAIGIVTVVAGITALARDLEISTRSVLGRVFVLGTVITCLTALPIVRHGGFGTPHALAIFTLIVLAVAYAGERTELGRASRYVAVIGYSFALFLHFIPATVETLTRLPVDAPYLANADDPNAQPILGVFFVIFVVGAAAQLYLLRRSRHRQPIVEPAPTRPTGATNMSISYVDAGDVRTIILSGRMDIGGKDTMATELVELSQVSTKVIVNLVAITMLASIGIRALVVTAKGVKQRGGNLVLVVDPDSMVMTNLKMTGLDQFVPIVSSAADAEKVAAG